MRTVLAISLTVVLLLALPARGRGVTVFAGRLEGDSRTGRVVAEGNVRVTDGRVTLQGSRLVLAAGRGTLSAGRAIVPEGVLDAHRMDIALRGGVVWQISGRGEASFETPRGVLFGDVIEFDPQARRARAVGSVRVFAPPDVVAFGAELVYRAADSAATLRGPVKVQSGQGVVTGHSLEVARNFERVFVTGPVRFDYGEGSGEARRAEVVPGLQVAVLEGEVFVQHGRSRLWAHRVMVFYRERRVVAEGIQRLLVEEGGVQR